MISLAARSIATHFLRAEFALFLIIFIGYGLTLIGYMNSLDGPQYALTRALADDLSIHIDKYVDFAKPDYALGKDGRAVSDREPGPSLLAVPFHFLGEALNPVLSLPYDGARPKLSSETKTQVITYTSLVFLVSLGIARAYVLLRRLDMSAPAAFLSCLLAAFGTLMWKYSGSFARQPALAVLFLLIVLELMLYHREKGDGRRLFLIGALAGLAVLHDYMAAIPLSLLAVAFIWLERPTAKSLLPAALAAMPFAVAVLVYNYVAFGELLTSPHNHEARIHWMHSTMDNFRTPIHIGLYLNLFSFRPIPDSAVQWWIERPEYYFQMGVQWAQTWTFKGLFVQSPFLLVALGGWALFALRNARVTVYAAVLVVTWLLLSSAVTVFWGAAPQHDGRYALPMVPVLAVGAGFLIDGFIRGHGGSLARAAACVLSVAALISLYFGWESVVTNFSPNISGEHRWAPNELMGTTGVTLDSAQTAFLETFPNVYNLHALVPLGVLLYGAALLAYRATTWFMDGWQLTRVRRKATAPPLLSPVPRPSAGAWGAIAAIVFTTTVLAVAFEPFGDAQHPTLLALEASSPSRVNERNTRRLEDLRKLKQTVVDYKGIYGSLPDSHGRLQSVCRYRDKDVGCSLEAVLSPIPSDPNGASFGYWYASDGGSFTLVAVWEGESQMPSEYGCPPSVQSQVPQRRPICLQQ
jgi:hypothetical protein